MTTPNREHFLRYGGIQSSNGVTIQVCRGRRPSAYPLKPRWRLPIFGYADSGGHRECLHVVDGCLQGVFQRADVSGDLGEEHAALVGGEQEIGQPSGIRLSADAAEPLHPFESVSEDVPPLIERVREFRANVKVRLDDLAGERA